MFAEPLLPIEMIGMLICFAGMITITFGGSKEEEEIAAVDTASGISKSEMLGYCLIFGTSWCMATCNVMNRALKATHSSVIMFWHGILGLVFAFSGIMFVELTGKGAAAGTGLTIFNYSAQVYLLLTAGTFCDSIALNCVTIAFQSDSSGFLALLSYSNILYAFVADRIIFKESFTLTELLATIVILIVTVGVSVVKLRENKKN